MTELRRTSAGRFSGALWGVLIAATGALMIASFSGFKVDFQLVAILALCGIGLWLLLTALFASGAKSRSAQKVAAMPIVDDDEVAVDAVETVAGTSPIDE
jgi:apolipoprotein N-acyltransferase